MTKKRYIVKGTDDFFQHIEDTTLTEDKHEGAIYNIYQVVDLLNEQDMHIFLLKCVIQTITAESMDKNISHKRIMEIKKHWYDKLYGDVE